MRNIPHMSPLVPTALLWYSHLNSASWEMEAGRELRDPIGSHVNQLPFCTGHNGDTAQCDCAQCGKIFFGIVLLLSHHFTIYKLAFYSLYLLIRKVVRVQKNFECNFIISLNPKFLALRSSTKAKIYSYRALGKKFLDQSREISIAFCLFVKLIGYLTQYVLLTKNNVTSYLESTWKELKSISLHKFYTFGNLFWLAAGENQFNDVKNFKVLFIVSNLPSLNRNFIIIFAFLFLIDY